MDGMVFINAVLGMFFTLGVLMALVKYLNNKDDWFK